MGPRTNAFGQAYGAIVGAMPVARPPIGWVDLGAPLRKRAVRKSYRSLINWGQKNLEISTTGTPAEFEGMRAFHAAVKGRVTRPAASWDICEDHVRAGAGELILGSLDGVIVSASLFIDGDGICVYWSGVYYEHSRFGNHPLAHYPLWLAINHAAQRGNRWFELGELGGDTEKGKSVAFFKRGFATNVSSATGPPAGVTAPAGTEPGVTAPAGTEPAAT